jgi:hypothetical protein
VVTIYLGEAEANLICSATTTQEQQVVRLAESDSIAATVLGGKGNQPDQRPMLGGVPVGCISPVNGDMIPAARYV